MSHATASAPAHPRRTWGFAGALVLAWAAAAAAARVVGVWMAIGPMAVLLAVLTLRAVGGSRTGAPWLRGALAWGVPAGGVMVAGTYLLHGPVTAALPWLREDIAGLYAAFDGPGRAFAAVAMPVVVVCEEIVWRGAVYAALPAGLGHAARVGLVTLLYAAAHAPLGSPGLAMACVGAGACWAALRAVTGQLAPVVVAHLIWDAVVLLWFPLA
ncbi:MAG: Type prenyl endopeptidase Rce1-like [Pseudomonadota bacterium]